MRHDFIAERNAKFMRLLIADEIQAHWLYVFTLNCVKVGRHQTFLNIAEKMEESPEQILSDLIAEGYWLCSGGSRVDEFIRTLPGMHDVFRKICERYPSEMKDVDRSGLSIERLKAMMIEGKLNEPVKNLVKRLLRCASAYGVQRLRSIEPKIEGLFWELFHSGELYEDMKRGFKRSTRIYEDAYFPHYFRNQLSVLKMSWELSRSRELDEEVKRALSMAIRGTKEAALGWLLLDMPNARSLLKELLCTVPKARELTRELLSAKEFDEMIGRCRKRPAKRCITYNLRSAKKRRIERVQPARAAKRPAGVLR